MNYETIALEVTDGVATLTLNRPDALNAFDERMAGELSDALRETSADDDVRALLLTGAGRAFCSGQDLKAITGERAPDALGDVLEQTWNPVVRALYQFSKPTLCAVNGVAAGAGASLAFACDLRVASEKASFIIVFSKVGLVPDAGATWTLPRLVGMGKALELAYTAEPVGAAEALRIGLVNRVVPHDDLAKLGAELAGQLARGPTKALSLTKGAMIRGLHTTFEEALVHETELQTACGRSDDFQEGLVAFAAKRQPAFKGS